MAMVIFMVIFMATVWSTQVAMPGAVVGHVSATTACRFGLPARCEVVAGTTDSIAAFIAANATTPGHAVTSLGSTLAVKMLSEV